MIELMFSAFAPIAAALAVAVVTVELILSLGD